MEKIKYIKLNYFGKKLNVENTDSYSGFKNKIKDEFKLTKEESKQLKFKFVFGNNDLTIDVNNRDEYKTAYAISQQFNKIYVDTIEPKPKFQNQPTLDETISKLKQEKKDLIKKYLQMKKKNKELMEGLNKESKESNQEVLNRIDIVEQSEQTINKKGKKNIKKIADIPENIKIKNKEQLKYDCLFIDNDNIEKHTIEKRINEISKHKSIKYLFQIYNNGSEEWPYDTFLKCETNDTPIFFYYSALKDNETKPYMDNQGRLIQTLEVIIVFKNYSNIQVGEYELKSYLISDKCGRIGNDYGILILKVLPSYNNGYNNGNDFNILNNNDNNYENDFNEDY